MPRWLEAHPERLALGVAALTWAWMIGQAATAHRFACCGRHPSWLEDGSGWLAMGVAMMVPTTLGGMRDVAARSYRARRVRAVVGYGMGYLAGWLALGVVVTALRRLDVAQDPRAAVAMCLVGAAWTMVGARERWWRVCHRRIPLCPVGRRADLDVIHQGAIHGGACVAMCWPIMLACTISGHNLVLMVGGMVLTLHEKRMFRLVRRPLVFGHLALGAWTLGWCLLG